MHRSSIENNQIGLRPLWMVLLLSFLLVMGMPGRAPAAMLDNQYPGLAAGPLKSAQLSPLDQNTLLTADGVVITHSQLLASIKDQDPKLRAQLEKNLVFVLEQEVIRQILLNEAKKAGVGAGGGDDNLAIKALFERHTRDVSVSEEQARAFYEANKAMMGGGSYEAVAYGLREYLLQEKKQQAISAYIDDLGDSANLRINSTWVAAQHRLALDNPVDEARRSGKATMVEFGATGCVPCDMMQPILDSLHKNYPENLNVVFVHVGEEQILAARYGIQSIPVQVFFDAKGREVFRHVGFFAESEVIRQLRKMGVEK